MSDWTEITGEIFTFYPEKIFEHYSEETWESGKCKTIIKRSKWLNGSEGCPEFRIHEANKSITVYGSIRDRNEDDVFKMILDIYDIFKTCKGFGYIRISSPKSDTLIECYPKTEKIQSAIDRWDWGSQIIIKKSEINNESPKNWLFCNEWKEVGNE